MLIPKKVFKSLGLFDPKFAHQFEDYDFCLRVQRSGLKVIYLPSAKFWHGVSLTADKNKPLKYYHWYQNKVRFLIKNLPLINIISILTFQILLIIPYRAIILRDGRFIPFLKGIFWNLKYIGKTLDARNKMQNYQENQNSTTNI